jgi:hypothetical protein
MSKQGNLNPGSKIESEAVDAVLNYATRGVYGEVKDGIEIGEDLYQIAKRKWRDLDRATKSLVFAKRNRLARNTRENIRKRKAKSESSRGKAKKSKRTPSKKKKESSKSYVPWGVYKKRKSKRKSKSKRKRK